ncbi:MAG: chromate transporter [Cyanobacterium sp. T60_A2020_053]|nr:chromate transporter [Cyanobacterium sp. T60_A2020_053]
MSENQQPSLKEIAQVFLRLGITAFGGPAAHVAMMDDEIVQKRQWMTRERLLDLLGVTNLIPGPNSTELAISIGYDKGGWRGLIVAGSCFIFPAMAIVWILAFLYSQYRTVPQADGLLYGIKPVIIAIVIQALWKLGKKAVKNWLTGLGALSAVIGYFMGIDEIVVLLAVGLGVMLIQLRSNFNANGLWLPLSPLVAQTVVGNSINSPSPLNVFLFFLKVGCFLYGSGYVLLAFLERALVTQNQWLTSQELLDAIAIGQFTPGPILTTATFIGYLLAGNMGAIMATLGIFLPSFILVLIINPWVDKLRQSPVTSALLDGVNAGSVGLMVGVAFILGKESLFDIPTIIIGLGALILLFRFQINSIWLILGGGALGFLLYNYEL